jgi:glycosyltransferase involved in cell wall biosynthesis
MERKLNVLQFICSTGFYGAERWVLALSKHLDKSKFTSSLAVTLEANSKDLELVKQFAKDGGATFEVPMSNPFDLSVINKLVTLIKEQNIDIIHTHGYKSDILGVLAAKKAGIKVVVTPHGFENADDIKLRTFIWLGCQIMRFADKVVPLSPQLCDDVKKYGVKNDNLVYIQNGVDLSEVEAQRIKPIDKISDEKHVGFIGQMISRKNIFDLLDIFDDLQQKHGNLRLSLLGDGEQRAELEEYAKTLKSNSKMNFLGFRDDRLEQLQSFDLFAMTSTLEGIPRCLMEALAMGIPTAAYDIAGVDRLVKHDETGLLAPFGDKKQLTEHWETILFDQDVSNRLSEQGRNFVNQHYSAKRMADEYADLFLQLVSESK